MIATLKGTLKAKMTDQVVVEAQGVGYQVFITLNSFYELPPEGAEVFFHIHTYMKEDHWSLYGFLTAGEKLLFQQLLKVNGVGPKTGLNILSGLSAGEVTQAIARGEPQILRKIPGVGQKVAEKIVIELKGKVLPTELSAQRPQASQTFDEALSALTRLGYTRPLAEGVLAKLNWEKGLGLKEAITLGLKGLAQGR